MKSLRALVILYLSLTSVAALAADPKADVEIKIASVGDKMLFDKKEFTVKSGKSVKITLKNTAKPASNMFHNVVIVARTGAETVVAAQGIAAGEAGAYVKPGPDVLAHTPLAKPGETVSVVFTAPAAGKYPFLCTFPGHAVMMKGVMKVE